MKFASLSLTEAARESLSFGLCCVCQLISLVPQTESHLSLAPLGLLLSLLLLFLTVSLSAYISYFPTYEVFSFFPHWRVQGFLYVFLHLLELTNLLPTEYVTLKAMRGRKYTVAHTDNHKLTYTNINTYNQPIYTWMHTH